MLRAADEAVLDVGDRMGLAGSVLYVIIKSFDLTPTFVGENVELCASVKAVCSLELIEVEFDLQDNYTFLPCRITIHSLRVYDFELLHSGRDLSESTPYLPSA